MDRRLNWYGTAGSGGKRKCGLTLLPQTPKPVSECENLLGAYSVLPTQREGGIPRDPGRIVVLVHGYERGKAAATSPISV